LTIGKWRVLNSREVLRDRWIHVRADACVTPSGVEVSPCYVLDYPDWVDVVAVDEHGRVLLIRQYRHGSGDISLELPAGAIDPTDVDALEAGARELREETGFAGEMSLVGVNSPNPANHANKIHTVLARNARSRGVSDLDDTEEIEWILVSVEDAVLAATGGEMHSAIQVASLFLGLKAAGLLSPRLIERLSTAPDALPLRKRMSWLPSATNDAGRNGAAF
jgi:8-oxo-dGTP pyrophosphatase MutT (NUDIX family)